MPPASAHRCRHGVRLLETFRNPLSPQRVIPAATVTLDGFGFESWEEASSMKSITAMLLNCLTLSCAAGVDAPAPDNINSPTAAKSDGHSADAPVHPFKCSVSDDHLLECQAEHPFFETTSMAIQTGDGAYVGSVVLDKNQPTQTFQLAADEYPYGLSLSWRAPIAWATRCCFMELPPSSRQALSAGSARPLHHLSYGVFIS